MCAFTFHTSNSSLQFNGKSHTMNTPASTENHPNILLRLWRDKETRSIFIQIITIVIVLTFLGLIINNVVNNLEIAGKDFSFGFLNYPAGYDITFQPFISYSPTDTHLRAAVVGVLNTLLVAVSGIILASILGFTMGVLRLSNNWLVSRLVYVFLEFTRNVPVLLHILFIYSIFLYVLPVPKKAINISDTVFLTNRGFILPSPVFEDGFGFVWIALLAAIAIVVFFVRWERKNQNATGEKYPCVQHFLGPPVRLTVDCIFYFRYSDGMGYSCNERLQL